MARLKTAYLFNIAKFVSWPQATERVRLCIDTSAPVGRVAQTLHGRELEPGRQIVISHGPDAAGACDIVYEEYPAGATIERSEDMLTISDSPDALNSGFVIGLFLQRDKLRFEVDQDRLRSAPYRISSKLLQLSRQRG